MFEKPFDLLNKAVDRIETQLTEADTDQRHILGEELIALRNACDKFVEQWLSFEERVTELGERYQLDLDGSLPTPELQDLQNKLAALQSLNIFPQEPQAKKAAKPAETVSQEPAKGASTGKSKGKNPPGVFTWQVGDGMTMRPSDEHMVRSFRRAIGYFDLLMYPEAINEFKRVVEIDGEFLIARLYLAFGYLAQGNLEEADHQLNMIQADEEDEFLQATVHATYGHIYAEQEKYEQALVDFEAAAQLVPTFKDVNYNIACCHFNLGNLREALTHFQRALVLDHEDWESHRLCGLIWEQLGHRERAYRHLARSYDVNGAHEQVLIDFARLSELMGEKDQARALYKKALRYYPGSGPAYGGLGWLAMRDGDVDGAYALFKKQVSCDPKDRQGTFNIGWAAYQSKQYQTAEACFNKLLTKNKRDAHALAGLARTWSQMGKREAAKEQLLQLVAMEGNAEKKLGLYHLGRLALEEETYTQALRYFNAALVYDRDCLESLFYKGIAHYALGERERAQQCFERCKVVRAEMTV